MQEFKVILTCMASFKDTESPSLSATLQQALLPSLILDALPKSQIDLFLTILESDGCDDDISAYVTKVVKLRRPLTRLAQGSNSGVGRPRPSWDSDVRTCRWMQRCKCLP